MAAEAIDQRLTPEQYLERERRAEFKSEYRDGELIAMAGASLSHNRITTNLVRHLANQLDGRPCDVFAQDMKTRTTATRYAYPDVIVVCGEPEFLDAHNDVVTNPAVIIEVLSESTEADKSSYSRNSATFDRGEKFAAYQRRETLHEYVLVAQDKRCVERYLRRDDGLWLYERLDGLDAVLDLSSVGCTVRLSDLYHRVDVGSPGSEG